MGDPFYHNDFLYEFIELYRSQPCIWKVKSKEYTNKVLRKRALEVLVDKCKAVYQEADVNFVLKRINSLRTSFRREFKKVEESKKSGAGLDEIYQPSLWYYDLLLFTVDQEVSTSGSNISILRQSTVSRCVEEISPISACSESRDGEVITSATSQATRANYGRKKTRNVLKESTMLEEAWKVLNSISKEDEFSAYGTAVAAKLRSMESDQQLFAENVIHHVLFMGLTKRLTASADVDVRNDHGEMAREFQTSLRSLAVWNLTSAILQ